MKQNPTQPNHRSSFPSILVLALFTFLPLSSWAAPTGTLTGTVEFAANLGPSLPVKGYSSLYRSASEPSVDPRADVVVYLENVPGTFTPPPRNAVTHHKAQHFIPRVVPLLKGQRFVIANDDPYDHAVQSESRKNQPFKRILKAGSPPLVYRTSYVEEILIHCTGHLRSVGYVLVLQNPFFTTIEKNGSFRLKDVPPGNYTLRAWHPDLAPVSTQVTVLARRELEINLIFEKVR